jgi:hypothetical protein
MLGHPKDSSSLRAGFMLRLIAKIGWAKISAERKDSGSEPVPLIEIFLTAIFWPQAGAEFVLFSEFRRQLRSAHLHQLIEFLRGHGLHG